MIFLSVIVIVKNEALEIRRCLESLRFADELIILDSGSVDDTVAICREYTDQVFITDWPGFGPQKNRALQKAEGEWVLSIDADEWVDDALREEILSVIQKKEYAGFYLPRKTLYLGRIVHHGDVGRDQVLRLFLRTKGHFTEDTVHEKICVEGKVGTLKNALMHNSYPSIEEILERMNWYTSLSAKARDQQGKSSSFLKAVLGGFWAFFKSYFLRAGFLDGQIGFIVAVTSAESSYYRHLKLLYLRDSACQK